MLFYANIFALGDVCAYNELDDKQNLLQSPRECYSKLLQLAGREIDQIIKRHTRPSEELIVCVLILSAYNGEFSLLRRNIIRHQAEYSGLIIDAYFFQLTTTNYHHASALRKLVSDVGGIDSIETPGIADLICLYVSSVSIKLSL